MRLSNLSLRYFSILRHPVLLYGHVTTLIIKIQGTEVPVQAWKRPRGFPDFEASRFQDNRHMKVAMLSALNTGQLYPHEIFLVLIYFRV